MHIVVVILHIHFIEFAVTEHFLRFFEVRFLKMYLSFYLSVYVEGLMKRRKEKLKDVLTGFNPPSTNPICPVG